MFIFIAYRNLQMFTLNILFLILAYVFKIYVKTKKILIVEFNEKDLWVKKTQYQISKMFKIAKHSVYVI